MKSLSPKIIITALLLILLGCEQDTQWAGQKPIQVVPTETRPIQKQRTGTFELGKGVFASNDFIGARLNGIVRSNDTLLTALITPENTPINPSPWYAFKLWAEEETNISLKLTYLEGVSHRYFPKLSHNGEVWESLDSLNYTESERGIAGDDQDLPKDITMHLSVGPDTLWVSAQELITSVQVQEWVDTLATLPYVALSDIGQSREGRPLHLLKIGNADDQKMIFVMTRQHPPEVTGHLAMEAFVEAIASDDPIAVAFRQQYNTYVVPFANPDGVDNGHWRHSAGGIDMNRDWANVNQPEVAAIQAFMEGKVADSGGKFYFGVDFHSTWEDIYYSISPELKGNMPGLVPAMIEAMGKELSLTPNIRPNKMDRPAINSSRYFFQKFGAEALTYEIGDNTPRDLLKRKGEVSALELMKLLLDKK